MGGSWFPESFREITKGEFKLERLPCLSLQRSGMFMAEALLLWAAALRQERQCIRKCFAANGAKEA